MTNQLQKGQVLLIVVLVMVVALTVGLSIASRSITNLRITNDDENSQRAFSAAEAGVERAVKSSCTSGSCPFTGTFTEDTYKANFSTTMTPIVGTQFLIKGGTQIKQDEGVDVWLSKYSSDPAAIYSDPIDSNVTVYWGDGGNPCLNAALQIMVLQGDKNNPQLSQFAYDPCASRALTNHFSTPSSGTTTIEGTTFHYSVALPSIADGLVIRVIPLYTNSIMGVRGTVPFPIQGQKIESIGRSGATDSEPTVRKVSFIQSYASVPSEFFQYVLMSL